MTTKSSSSRPASASSSSLPHIVRRTPSHVEAVAAENAAYKANTKAPIAATDAARSAMEATKHALLSAALAIT